MQVAEVGLEPELAPKPDDAPATALLVTPHRSGRGHIINVFVFAEALQPIDQFAVLANLKSFIESAALNEVFSPANDDPGTACVH